MPKNSRILAIIPARGGSRGVPRKNIRPLAGKPLIVYTIQAAIKSRIFDKLIISTENLEIAQVARRYKGINIIKRPKKLATPSASAESVMIHALRRLKKENYIPDVICLLQPTSPLRDAEDIKKAFKRFFSLKVDSLFSVCPNHLFIWREDKNGYLKPLNYNFLHRPRRQEIKHEFRENGAIYITKRKVFDKFHNRLGGRIGYYLMDEKRSLEIDTLFDLSLVEKILR